MNILMIFTDQQHKFAFGKQTPDYETPTLDNLCEDGILFNRAYSPNPICGPYRGCLMSGQFTSHCGVVHNGDALSPDCYTLASAMKDAGYTTAYVGKWHLGDTGNVHTLPEYRVGFDRFVGYQCYNGFEPAAPHYNDVKFFDMDGKEYLLPIHRTDATTAIAMEELRQLSKQDKPFFLSVSYQAPHYPEQPSAEYAARYQNKTFTLPPDYEPIDPYTKTFSPPSAVPKENDPDYQAYGNDIQAYLRLYGALCTQVDTGVGRILDLLKTLNLADDTMVIYTADHGDMQGSHGQKNKSLPYEMSAGVPFIVKHPQGRKGVRSEALVSALDIYPTLLDCAGVAHPEGLDGVSIYDYCLGKQDDTQDYIISEFLANNPWRMVCTKTHKLVTTPDYMPTALYDMVNDPYEMENILPNHRDSEMVANMIAILQQRTA